MSVTSIFILNLPLGITVEELTSQLTELHPNVFATPYDDTLIDVKIFTSRNGAPTAVVRGLDYNFERMMLETRGLEISHQSQNPRIVGIKPDLGDQRNADGSFTYSVAASFKREFLERVGISHRQIFGIFRSSFWSSVNVVVFGGQRVGDKKDNELIRIDKPPRDISLDVLAYPGGLKYCREEGPRDTYARVMFHSILEQIQTIAKLNFNDDLMTTPSTRPRFTSLDQKLVATISTCRGLGKNGGIIPIEELSLEKGYVPFSEFNYTLLNKPYFDGLISRCWRCKSAYTLLGVNLHLTSLAGTCECPPDRFGLSTGYSWLGESFTRLSLGRTKGERTKLQIVHYPLKQVYKNAEEYRQVVIALLEEEWYFHSTEFGEENRTTGIVTLASFIETITGYEDRDHFAIKVTVPCAKVWTPENKSSITRATLIWKNMMTKAKVARIRSAPENKVHVILQIKIPAFLPTFQVNDVVEIIPKPSKCEYRCMRKSLNEWVRFPEDASPLTQLLLDPGRPPKNNSDWKNDELAQSSDEEINHLQKLRISLLGDNLNETQKLALERAEQYCASVIQGPPGTGKTFCVAALALTLAFKEKGSVVVCAPSNFAADGIALTLNNMMTEFSIKQKVLRIYSVTKAGRLLDVGNRHEGDFDTLHEEVRKSPEWLNDPSMADLEIIKDRVISRREFLLTKYQQWRLDAHISSIEYKILRSYKIIVSTVGCLSDNRLINLADPNEITTVVLDEAGQLSQPSTLSLLRLRPKRLVLAGDQLQLPSTVLSFAAATAGLGLSLMDVLAGMDRSSEKNYPSPPPWTTLLVQHRMAPPIRELVSNLTYDDRLCDSALVINREVESCMESLVERMGGKRVGVLDHKGLEQQSSNGCGYYNDREILTISKFMKTLKDDGIPMEKVTILSFYDEQRSRLIDKLGKEIDIRNVDAFQGRENAIVIVSFVRANTTSNTDMGFLSSLNRINVAISRAQQFLFLACNLDFFRRSQLQHMIKLCKKVAKVGKIL